MNVYKIVPPFYVSFSGGRTSAYMLRQVLDAWGGSLPSGGHVLFANTGREHPATYDFVERIGLEWCPVTWVEWRPVGFAELSPAHASRNGEPFAELIRKRKFLPNPIARFCTSDLKVIPMRKWMESHGYDDFTTVIGLRADEKRRVAKLRADQSRDIAMPLADAERRGRAAQASGMSDWFYSPNQIAAEYGWDCFGVTKCRSPAAPTDKPTQEDTE